MSDHAHDLPEAEKFDPAKLGGLPKLLLGAGGIGLLLTAVGGFILGKEQFAYTYLFAFSLFSMIILGAGFWTCVHHATDSEWSVLVRRQMENIASLFPIMAVFVLPIVACAGILLKWWNMGDGIDPLLDAKRPFLSQPFVYFRLVAYFGIVGWVVWSLRRHSIKQDEDGSGRHTFAMRKLGIGGIAAIALTITFFGIDWLMGLDYHWFSTMWGVYLFAGAAGSSMSVIVLTITVLKNLGYLKPVNDQHFHTMGKWMLAFTIFWAYIGFDQYMLIWYANIPEENIYFIIRNQGNWCILNWTLVIGRFFLVLPILLQQTVKKRSLLWIVALWMISMEILDLFVVVLPVFHKTGFTLVDVIYAICPLVGIGGILGWAFLKKLTACNLFPTRDPRLLGSLHLQN